MVKFFEIEECIDFIFNHVKNFTVDNKIKFSRIEKYSFENRIQWLLSVVLIKSYTEEDIDEIVLETNLTTVQNEYKISMDLSYGNGIILNDSSISILKGESLCKEDILKNLKSNLFDNIGSDILLALNEIAS